MKECEMGENYSKSLFVNIKEGKEHQKEKTEDFVEEPTFDISGSTQSLN